MEHPDNDLENDWEIIPENDEDWNLFNKKIRQKEERQELANLIRDIKKLSQWLEPVIQSWHKDFTPDDNLCGAFATTLKKLCENKSEISYWQQKILKPLLIWLDTRKMMIDDDDQLIRGLEYIINYIITVQYFSTVIQNGKSKVNRQELNTLHFIDNITRRLVGCDNHIHYRFMVDLNSLLTRLKERDISKYSEIKHDYDYFVELCEILTE